MPNKKSKDTRPARARYWAERHLEKNKVKRLLRCNGFKKWADALAFWRSVRTKRMKT